MSQRLFMAIGFMLMCIKTSALPADFTTVAGWDNQLFPAYLIATASVRSQGEAPANVFGDREGQLGVRIEAAEDDQEVEVTIVCDEYFEASTWSGRLPTAGESYGIFPKIRYRFDKLARCLQATPATVIFRVKIGGETVQESTETVTMRSINDCPFKIVEGDEIINTSFTFAAYVNEQHPFVDKLLREALDIGIVEKFDGYQSGRPEDVVRQVYALWDLMVARDVRYSSITTTAASSNTIACQHVRMIEDIANNSQANCVDGSVLFVSMLRKIGINAALVMQPGHCFVAFTADREGKEIIGLETTLVGSQAEEPDNVPELFENAVDEDYRVEASWPGFLAALKFGDQELEVNRQNENNPDYELIRIDQWRAIGILPIPFTGRETFVSYDHSASEEATETAADETADDSGEQAEEDE